MKFKLPKFPHLPHLPRLSLEPVKKVMAFLLKHRIAITISLSVIVFIVVAMWYRGYLLSKMSSNSGSSGNEIFNSSKANNSLPTIAIPTTAPDNNTDNSNTDNSNSDNSDSNYVAPPPYPTFCSLPTLAPVVITTPTTTSSSGNPNCTTSSGTPNSWYSDVYPNPPVSTSNGSVTMTVTIRDCNSNTAPVSDNLSVSLSSGDSNTQINGNSLPTTITTQNGQASFTVTSQVSGNRHFDCARYHQQFCGH